MTKLETLFSENSAKENATSDGEEFLHKQLRSISSMCIRRYCVAESQIQELLSQLAVSKSEDGSKVQSQSKHITQYAEGLKKKPDTKLPNLMDDQLV